MARGFSDQVAKSRGDYMSRENWEAFLRSNEPRDPYRDYLRETDRAYRNFLRDRQYLRDLSVPIDLRAYEVAYYYDGQDRAFSRNIAGAAEVSRQSAPLHAPLPCRAIPQERGLLP